MSVVTPAQTAISVQRDCAPGAGAAPSAGERVAVILRGPSGSGKSSLVRRLTEGRAPETYSVCSADKYFVGPDGVYRFSQSRIGDAHMWAQMQFLDAIEDGRELIIVDNTHSQLWEYAPYAGAARVCGYRVRVIEIRIADEETLRRVNARNKHGVSLKVAQAMVQRWQRDPAAELVDPVL